MRSNIKYTKEIVSEAVAQSHSLAGALRHLGLAPVGGNHGTIKRKIIAFEIDTSHFTGQGSNKGKPPVNKKSPDAYFELRPIGSAKTEARRLRAALIYIVVAEICAECQLGTQWNGKVIRLQVDHIDGNNLNNLRENLRFLCPNCHSQTSNWGILNKKSLNK